MKQFKPGDFCRFQNEQIPRILDILRANGYSIGNTEIEPSDLYIVFCDFGLRGNVFVSTNMENQQPYHREISKHDFMTIALRLDFINDPLLDTELPMDQSSQITKELRNLIGDDHIGFCVYSTDESRPKGISYLEFCRRLCVEPITEVEKFGENTSIVKPGFVEEKTLEQHVDEYDVGKFDPTKPFEVSSNGVDFEPCNDEYVGFHSSRNQHVLYFEDETSFYHVKHIRNTKEFNASMLEVGEYMVIEEDDSRGLLNYNGAILFRSAAFDLICISPNHDCTSHTWDKKATIKGRKVQVEIKIIEP